MSQSTQRALVIGGTGMLLSATLALSQRCSVLCVVGRSAERLARVRGMAADRGGTIEAVNADYDRSHEFAEVMQDLRDRSGPFDLAICWIHSHALPALSAVVGTLARPSRLLHVVGSAVDDPAQPQLWSVDRDALADAGIEYRRIVLGFVMQNGRVRWLTHEEICAGVLRSLDGPPVDTTVGQTRPWHVRP